MLLYDSPISGNCYKVRLLLAHLGIAYERRTIDVIDRCDRPEVLGGLNPALRVPTLVLETAARSPSRTRSCGTSPRAPVHAGDSYERAQVLQWMFFEQYDHEPTIAVVPLLGRVRGEPAGRARDGGLRRAETAP